MCVELTSAYQYFVRDEMYLTVTFSSSYATAAITIVQVLPYNMSASGVKSLTDAVVAVVEQVYYPEDTTSKTALYQK